MRCIIAGSRTITDPRAVASAVTLSGFDVSHVISGGARGVDVLGEAWAGERGIPVQRFPADWKRYGRRAGVLRNIAMLEAAAAAPEGGCVVAVWDGRSSGTRHTIESGRRAGLPVYVFNPDHHPADPSFHELLAAVELMQQAKGGELAPRTG